MIRFVENAAQNLSVPVSEIASIGEGRKRASGKGFVFEARLKNGREMIIDSDDVEQLLDPLVATIPATPGYNTIETGTCSNGEAWTVREPVLAWQITQCGGVRPVTIRGPNDSNTYETAVEKPSGDIWCPCEDTMFHSFDEFREAELRRAAERRALNAARQEEV